ncbi:MAG TPA: hypothetical protein DDX39_02785 [Bacteroidales bacterium]|nr:hypothetical protein [Bacteroidales bacterium]
MHRKNIILIVLSFLFGISTSFMNLDGENVNKNVSTTGNLSFSITTSTTGLNFAPKHVVAVWIEDESGDFVKTLKVRANYQINYLYQWKNSSSSNTVDAITGATLTSHQTHNLTWDCTDVSGNVVIDGTYKIRVEFSEKNGQGPYTQYTFIKGATSNELNPADETYFKDVSIVYTPDATTVEDVDASDFVSIYPNPASDFVVLSCKKPINGITIYNMLGQAIDADIVKNNQFEYRISFKKEISSGVYFYKLNLQGASKVGKFLIEFNRL